MRVLLPLLIAVPVASPAVSAENLARGVPYSYSPPALYPLTHDDRDAVKLTDGKLAHDPIWTSHDSVGWLTTGAPITIELDLGKSQSIGKVCLRSARRAEAGVSLPRRVDVFGSQDRSRYGWMGNLISPDRAAESYRAEKFCSAELRRSARYVKLLVAAKGAYFFTDELEVWSAAGRTPDVVTPLAAGELRMFTLEYAATTTTVSRVRERLEANRSDTTWAEALRRLAAKLADSSGALGMAGLAAIDAEARQILRSERAVAGQLLEVRPLDPWRLSAPIDKPGQDLPSGSIDAIEGGHAAVVIGIDHAGDRPVMMDIAAAIDRAPGEGLRLGLLRVVDVMRADGARVGDALVPLSRMRGVTGPAAPAPSDLPAYVVLAPARGGASPCSPCGLRVAPVPAFGRPCLPLRATVRRR